ncbi:hypothetical protein HN592_00970 [Candidatus Woesearchaeota archaeon]|jgi:hypothetical protein|nr:hypothetical protein [Candidatus Woesearchaeota archaeon]MBT4368876.1 hypothetical protein [Candidatus Woesearchaeota archaeon]MBT4712165.1 hypothetical protein [Candidatus Woesearchaeota archaeon]MBT6639087.1 hypothetical protein [Candidatus Woesearchaeota archaeon]MBT7134287.1 hypothetical protein [Candidatus Woesearchaeota archaeon]
MELIIGLIGMGLILFAFFMNQIHRWKSDSLYYDIVNVIGSLLLTIYALRINSWPFLILNAIWLVISIKDVFSDVAREVHLGHKKK